MTYDVGGVVGGAAITGIARARDRRFLEIRRRPCRRAPTPPPDSKQQLRATLPLWNNLKANAEIHDLTLQTPMGEAKLKTLGETIGLSGFTAAGAAEIGLKVDRLTFKSALLPAWADELSPASLSLDLRVAGGGLDEVAELALDDPNFGGKGDLSPETQDKIGADPARRATPSSPSRPAG